MPQRFAVLSSCVCVKTLDAMLLWRMLSSFFLSSFFLFHFPIKIYAHLSSWETSAIELKLYHNVQNGLNLWLII